MTIYTVEWTINLSAESVEDAVRQAWGILRDPESTATYFRVKGVEGGKEVNVFRDFANALEEKHPALEGTCHRCAHPITCHAGYPESSKCLVPGCDSFLEGEDAVPLG